MKDQNFSDTNFTNNQERNCISLESPFNMNLAYAMLKKFLEEEVKLPPLSET